MAKTEFRVKPHGTLPDAQMVEVWRDGVFMAGIYPHEDGIRIVSQYMDGVEFEAEHPPSAVMHLSRAEVIGEGEGVQA